MPHEFNMKRLLMPVQDIIRKLNDHRSKLMEDVAIIDDQLSRLGGGKRGRRKGSAHNNGNGTEAVDASPTKRKGKRTRRNREELAAVAGDVVALIKGKGKEGATAKEVKSQFGNLLPSVNAWLKLYSPVKVKTTGEKSQMRYFA